MIMISTMLLVGLLLYCIISTIGIILMYKTNFDLENELCDEREINFEIKSRFVKCNTCTSDMKNKCLMWSENLCEGERCNELIDIQSLMNKDNLVIH